MRFVCIGKSLFDSLIYFSAYLLARSSQVCVCVRLKIVITWLPLVSTTRRRVSVQLVRVFTYKGRQLRGFIAQFSLLPRSYFGSSRNPPLCWGGLRDVPKERLRRRVSSVGDPVRSLLALLRLFSLNEQ